MDNIQAENLFIGKNVVIEKTANIRGVKGKANNISIGDNTYIGHNVQIICDDFSIGDYSKIHHDTNIHGYKPCVIGHNAWIGQFVIIDSIGGVKIGNNCGIGAHSQLWSHIKFGDTLEGCRFLTEKELCVGNDVWFVGHCIVSPVAAKDKSMAMVGSVITKDMEFNTIYAGAPAKEISSKIGLQFKEVSIEEKKQLMSQYLEKSNCNNIKIVGSHTEFNWEDSISYFDVLTRTYTKKRTEDEIKFMLFLLPEKGKFIPSLIP